MSLEYEIKLTEVDDLFSLKESLARYAGYLEGLEWEIEDMLENLGKIQEDDVLPGEGEEILEEVEEEVKKFLDCIYKHRREIMKIVKKLQMLLR
mgnify:CR=1 FL=1